MKHVTLKNIYTGEIVFCKNINETIEGGGLSFVKVFKENNPQRTFLVNKEAFKILNK
jgi:hypothetical protein